MSSGITITKKVNIMPTELKTISGKLAVNLKTADQANKIDLKQRGFEFIAALQPTLDIETLVRTFYSMISQDLLLSGATYHNEPIGIEPIKIGLSANQKSTYNLKIEDSELGTISFMRRRKFSNALLEDLENLLCNLLYPLRNAIKYNTALQLSQKDHLTGVLNRSAMTNSLEREVNLAFRTDKPFAVLMLDIDHFKNVNDTFGHAAGDEVLKAFTQSVKDTTRCSDNFFRYGGEEFILILSSTDQEGAKLLAERIRINVEATCFRHNNQTIPVTVSIGVAELHASENYQALLENADSALYHAKENGRNQVHVN
jgi:diguanylate cyclase (GGDEF)-like protein